MKNVRHNMYLSLNDARNYLEVDDNDARMFWNNNSGRLFTFTFEMQDSVLWILEQEKPIAEKENQRKKF